jgi:hypothetical protein
MFRHREYAMDKELTDARQCFYYHRKELSSYCVSFQGGSVYCQELSVIFLN